MKALAQWRGEVSKRWQLNRGEAASMKASAKASNSSRKAAAAVVSDVGAHGLSASLKKCGGVGGAHRKRQTASWYRHAATKR
jgi:hypothetical protein